MTLEAASATSAGSPATENANPIVTETNVTVESPITENGGGAEPPVGDNNIQNPPTETPTEPQKPKATPDWAQKRINELTAKRYEAERAAEEALAAKKAAETRAEELLAKIADPTKATEKPPLKTLTEEEVERRAVERAKEIARVNEFNKACNNIVEIGKRDYKEEWDAAVQNLNMVGALGKDVPTTFLENAIELRDPHKVLHYLGTNIEEGARIAQLPPTRMAMELARVEAALGNPPVEPKPPVSKAPAPVIPVGGQAKNAAPPSLDDPDLSADEWYALRAKQLQEKRERYRR